MKTKFKSKLLGVLLVLVMVLAFVPVSALTAFAAERDREIVAVDSGNSFNMRLSDEGVSGRKSKADCVIPGHMSSPALIWWNTELVMRCLVLSVYHHSNWRCPFS